MQTETGLGGLLVRSVQDHRSALGRDDLVRPRIIGVQTPGRQLPAVSGFRVHGLHGRRLDGQTVRRRALLHLQNTYAITSVVMLFQTPALPSVAEWLACWARAQKGRVHIAAATLYKIIGPGWVG